MSWLESITSLERPISPPLHLLKYQATIQSFFRRQPISLMRQRELLLVQTTHHREPTMTRTFCWPRNKASRKRKHQDSVTLTRMKWTRRWWMNTHLLTWYNLDGKSQTTWAQPPQQQPIKRMTTSQGLAGVRERALHWDNKKRHNQIMQSKRWSIIRRRTRTVWVMALSKVTVHMKVIIKLRPTMTQQQTAAMKRTTHCLWKKLRLMKNLSLKWQTNHSMAVMPRLIQMKRATAMMANMVMS